MRTRTELVDRTIDLISAMVSSTRRFSSDDCAKITGLTIRSSQRYLNDLEATGYVQGDDSLPRGYRPTDKAKKIFRVVE